KRYLAICRGVVEKSAGTIQTPYGRHPTQRLKFTSKSGPKTAVTEYRVLGRSDGCSALELTLHTGRTHQIRVHLADRGHPFGGDPGGRERPPNQPQIVQVAFKRPARARVVADEERARGVPGEVARPAEILRGDVDGAVDVHRRRRGIGVAEDDSDVLPLVQC